MPRPKKEVSPTERTADQKTTDPYVVERDAAWSGEARDWAAEQIQRIVDAEPSREFTAGEFMSVLDRVHPRSLPAGYVRFLDSELYPKRYAIVRVACQRLAKQGVLDVGTTVNAKGLEDVNCYRKAVKRPSLSVEILGPGVTESLKDSFEKWLTKHSAAIDSILVTRSP